jgi:monovalent cation/hydrogen antiporter
MYYYLGYQNREPAMHDSLLLSLGLILVILILVMLGEKLRISYPIFLVIGGLAISFIPGLPTFDIDPDLIFLIFLPPLLYEAAWNTSWKDFWRWRRVISVFAFGLVILTSCIVAVVSNAMIPAFTISLGFLLGGIISPPDAVAATSVLKGIKVPKRVIQILEGESLVNDAASLIVFRFALAAVISGTFVLHMAALNFVFVTVMGVVIGVVVALIIYSIHRWFATNSNIDTALTLIAPYLMYLAAEQFHVSGVMAVVSGGLFISYRSHKIFSHSTRLQATSMWTTVSFILNGLVFMLIGLELRNIINGLEEYSLGEALGYALVISLVIIAVRIGFVLFTSAFTMWISRFIKTEDSRPGWRGPLIIGWAGMRGVVSLASALSIPLLLDNGEAFPQRNLILFITFIAILVTLVIQGLTLPLVIRLVKYQDPDHHRPELEQESEIKMQLSKLALEALNQKHKKIIETNALVLGLRDQIAKMFEVKQQLLAEESSEKEKANVREYIETFIDIIEVQRIELHKLRNDPAYDHDVVQNLEAQMDLEEEKLRLQLRSH